MLLPIPGQTFLKVLAPSSPPAPTEHGPDAPTAGPTRRAAAGLVLVALQAAFGMRPVERLPRRRYALQVRTHIKARLRSSPTRGPVRLESFQVVGREVFGTAAARGKVYGFTAVVDDGRVSSFRVL